jgi:protein-S-isoprenylcysteine O-methyltransferase Ste14
MAIGKSSRNVRANGVRCRLPAMIRPITLILAFGYLAFEIYLLATRRGRGPMTRDDRGTLVRVWVLILGSCLFGFLVARLFSFLQWPQRLWIAVVADLLIVAGVVLRLRAIRHLGKFFTVGVAIQSEQRVVQDGPYRLVRHPSYSASLIAMTGVACLTFNWLGFIAIVAGCLAAYSIRISVEEKVLISNLGDDYRQYAARTKRLIPWIF